LEDLAGVSAWFSATATVTDDRHYYCHNYDAKNYYAYDKIKITITKPENRNDKKQYCIW
jgi:hypothetical protein